MTGRDLLLEQQLLSFFGKLEQTQRIGDRGTSLRDNLGDFGLRQVHPLHQTTVSISFFDRIQIGSLDILDKGELESLILISVFDADGHFLHL